TKFKFFKIVPPIVIIYFGAMLMSTMGVWQLSLEGTKTGAGIARIAVKNALLPSMVFLMLLKCDIRSIFKLGPRLLLAFFSATLSIIAGFAVAFLLFKDSLADNAWQTFGALAGSWIGGAPNMVAIQQGLGLSDAGMGYTLLIDSINYSVWIMFLLFFVSNSIMVKKFNTFNKANSEAVETVSERLMDGDNNGPQNPVFLDLFGLLALAFGTGALFTWISGILPKTSFLHSTIWLISLATVAGVVGGMTRLKTIPGSKRLSNIMLYTMVALIASNANFRELIQAPAYIAAGFVILGVHLAVMLILAKLFKLDLFTCCIASCANIGGVASAPVIAGAYNDSLVPVGVIMGMTGAIVGNAGGLLVAKMLSMFV
ncbi:MAG: DUF819 family protein, partial [Candidatus Electrothrix sp. AR3]|nr:DUF819 family protein [Candidatus Electrothrix sp. AR3]